MSNFDQLLRLSIELIYLRRMPRQSHSSKYPNVLLLAFFDEGSHKIISASIKSALGEAKHEMMILRQEEKNFELLRSVEGKYCHNLQLVGNVLLLLRHIDKLSRDDTRNSDRTPTRTVLARVGHR